MSLQGKDEQTNIRTSGIKYNHDVSTKSKKSDVFWQARCDAKGSIRLGDLRAAAGKALKQGKHGSFVSPDGCINLHPRIYTHILFVNLLDHTEVL